MYINKEKLTEKIGMYRINKFIANTNLEYDISYLNNIIIIRRYEMLSNDTFINVLKIRCTERQYDKIINMLVHY